MDDERHNREYKLDVAKTNRREMDTLIKCVPNIGSCLYVPTIVFVYGYKQRMFLFRKGN
jgi:hypothetical protein